MSYDDTMQACTELSGLSLLLLILSKKTELVIVAKLLNSRSRVTSLTVQVVQRARQKIDDRAFSLSASLAWNRLPIEFILACSTVFSALMLTAVLSLCLSVRPRSATP